MRRTVLLALLPFSALLVAGCGHHGSATPARASASVPVPTGTASVWASAGARPSATPTRAATPSAPTGSATIPAPASPTAPAGSAPTVGTAPGGPTSAATAGTPAAGSTASAQGLDRPVGRFGSVRGISAVVSGGGLVTGFDDTVTVAAGHAEALPAATAQLSAYLPAGTTYGASSTAGACRTVQLLGSRHPTDVAFCSDTTSGAGAAAFTAASIAEITVSADAGLG